MRLQHCRSSTNESPVFALPEIDPALPDAAQREADGEEASLVQQSH